MAKRLPKPYRHELNNGRYPNHLSILIMSDYTGIITSTNSMERAEATIEKNNKKYPFGAEKFNPSMRSNAARLGREAILSKIETEARRCVHGGDKPFGMSVYYFGSRKDYYRSYGPYMVNDPLHKVLNP